METAPLLGIVGLVVAIDWVIGGRPARDRLMGFGIALCAVTLAASIVFRTDRLGLRGVRRLHRDFGARADGRVVRADRAGAGRMAIRRRACGSRCGVSSALALGATLALSTPQCLSPYGGVDPLLQRCG